jgi:hypothetical protein
VSSRHTVAELLKALASVMAEGHLPWYLFGAQAAIIWGSPRLSADIDITAVIEPASVEAFVDTMTRHGFDVVFADSDFVARTRVLPFVHQRTGVPIDIVLAGPGLEEDFLHRAICVDLEGTPISVISPEDLVITKVLAGRPKDIEDVRNVVHQRRASLDAERIRNILQLLERALGQSDLLPVFESAWLQDESIEPPAAKRPTRKGRKKK